MQYYLNVCLKIFKRCFSIMPEPSFLLFHIKVYYLFFFFFSSTSLLLPTHLPPPSCTHAQSCNPMDFSPPDSSVHGFFQTRILEQVAISFSKKCIILRILLRLKNTSNINQKGICFVTHASLVICNHNLDLLLRQRC